MSKLIILSLSVLCLGMGSANGQTQKKMVGKAVKVPGAKTIKKTESDKRYFRAYGNGTGHQERVAKHQAEADARTDLTAQIKQIVKTNPKAYISNPQIDNPIAFDKWLDEVAIITAKNVTSGVAPSGYELYYKKASSEYNAYVMIELKRKAVESVLRNEISKNKHFMLDANKKAFEEIFDAEMEE